MEHIVLPSSAVVRIQSLSVNRLAVVARDASQSIHWVAGRTTIWCPRWDLNPQCINVDDFESPLSRQLQHSGILVRVAGLEPARLTATDFKSVVSAYSTIPAYTV